MKIQRYAQAGSILFGAVLALADVGGGMVIGAQPTADPAPSGAWSRITEGDAAIVGFDRTLRRDLEAAFSTLTSERRPDPRRVRAGR